MCSAEKVAQLINQWSSGFELRLSLNSLYVLQDVIEFGSSLWLVDEAVVYDLL